MPKELNLEILKAAFKPYGWQNDINKKPGYVHKPKFFFSSNRDIIIEFKRGRISVFYGMPVYPRGPHLISIKHQGGEIVWIDQQDKAIFNNHLQR